MTNRLANKVAVLTGAGSGIGQACALRLAAEGARVVVVDLQKAGGEETLAKIENAGGQGAFHQTDVSRESQCQELVQKTFEHFGRLDILVNNAGIYPRATLEQTTEAFWDQIMGVNLKGPFFLCKYAVPIMRAQGGGSIINTGSVHGLGGAGKLFAYAISKGGLLTLTRNLAIALVQDKIRVNYLIPGWVLSPTELRIQAEEGHDENWIKKRGASLGMGRFQLPEDAANVVAFLASDESVMITGCVLNVDAGYSVRCIGTEEE